MQYSAVFEYSKRFREYLFRITGMLEHVCRIDDVKGLVRKWKSFTKCVPDATGINSIRSEHLQRASIAFIESLASRFDPVPINIEMVDPYGQICAETRTNLKQLL